MENAVNSKIAENTKYAVTRHETTTRAGIVRQSIRKFRWTLEDVQSAIRSAKIVIFAKGNAEKPRCGFTAEAIEAVEKCGQPYEVVDVSSNRSLIPALRKLVGRKMLPLVYVDGLLIGSSEDLQSIVRSGLLSEQVNRAFV